MHRTGVLLASLLAAFVLTATGCTKVYTEADIEEEEQKLNAAADSEEEYSRSIDESGGVNEVLLERDTESVLIESDR